MNELDNQPKDEILSNFSKNMWKIAKRLSSYLGTITRKVNEIKHLLQDEANIDWLEEESRILAERVGIFQKLIDKDLAKVNSSENDQTWKQEWFKEKMEVIDAFRNEILDWINHSKGHCTESTMSPPKAFHKRINHAKTVDEIK